MAVVEYVMVPVPEELAAKVQTFVSWKDAQANAEPPSGEGQPTVDDAIARAFARLDDAGRALVGVVADATLEAEELRVPEAARRAGVTTREALGILLEVNSIIAAEGGPPLAFGGKPGEGSPGEFTWDSYVIAAPEALVRQLAEVARAHGSGTAARPGTRR
ncbi:MAG TPA: hypothetical protein VKD21_17120 [Acidimicrobiales bacterium]|nr:hypothetical protein [Acidimicrobiales bacterium]